MAPAVGAQQEPPGGTTPTGSGSTVPRTAPPTTAAPAPSTPSTPSTTAPAEVAVPVPDAGALDRLLADARAAATALRAQQLASAEAAVRAADAQSAQARARLAERQAAADAAASAVAAAEQDVATWRERISAFAADAYMRVGTDRDESLTQISGSDDPEAVSAADDSRRTSIYADNAVAAARRGRAAATRRLQTARAERATADDAVAVARSDLDALSAIGDSTRTIADAVRSAPLAVDTEAVAAGLSARGGPTILGPSLLGADDLAAFVRARGAADPSIDLDALAAAYVDEGDAEGVRADVAWAQSIVETGAFGFAGSMVHPDDHNYAGIGACDSCTSGFRYATPQLGVRAQIQLLRTYADRRVTSRSLSRPPVGRPPEQVGVRGCCTTWMALSGRWATGPQYGIKILTVYNEMLRFAADRHAAAQAAPPGP